MKGVRSGSSQVREEQQKLRLARQARSRRAQERGFYYKSKSHGRLLRRDVKRLDLCVKQLCSWTVNELRE